MIEKKKNSKKTATPVRIISRVLETTDKGLPLREANELKNFVTSRKGDKSICIISHTDSGDTNSAYLYVFDVQPKLVVRISDHAANPKNIETRTSSRVKAPSESEEFKDKWSVFHEVLDVTKKIK